MGNRRYQKGKDITLSNQAIALKASYPSATCTICKNTLLWRGKVRPSPLSREYSVQMTYKLRRTPCVWVFGNELQKLDNPNFPHHYEIDAEKQRVEICLYRYKEFSSSKFLSKTIIPWTVEWLYFYEIWLATGEWCGGGEHPGVGQRKEIELIE